MTKNLNLMTLGLGQCGKYGQHIEDIDSLIDLIKETLQEESKTEQLRMQINPQPVLNYI